MKNLSGTNLKGYELLERIGAGGFGAVYRARQTTIDREVAVKIILPGLANEPDFIRRFETEARLIVRLEHPHITPLHDFWRDPDGAYLVMRYLRGGSLRDAIYKEGAYDLDSTSRLLDQMASALDLAHRNEVVHRDIKPGNILLDEDGNAYLADFGIAKDLINVKNGHTGPDSVVGSLDYISPEQARSEPVTPRTDIYSLGVTLYEMITGEHPFKEYSSVERLYKHINDPLPAIVNLPEDARDTINEIVHRATAKNPDQRYPDVLALAVAFRESIGRGDTSRDLNIVEQLTWREQEVVQLIAEGRSNKEIADKLFVTLATVRWHIRQLYKKLGVRGRVQAIVRARELDLIVTGETDYQPAKRPVTVISLPEPENPYKGLHAFEAADSRDFFGREDFTEKLIRRMGETERFNRFLAVVGPSGSGKSSLVKAGLIPALWKGGLPRSERWFVVEMIPGTRPLDQLEVALVRVAANQASGLGEHLARDENGLLRVADIILPKDDTQLVLIVDQFEEVFTLVEEEQERAQFLKLLHATVTDPRSRIRVIMTLRADYYDRPLHYPEFGELIRSRMETVLPLSAKSIERAIAGPAERVGVTFEPGLVAQMVSEMNYQAGALPLLQYALTELFDRRQGRIMTHQSYHDLGGAVGALAHRADEIYTSFEDSSQELARQMFLRLVTLGEGAEDTRRRALRSELLQLTIHVDLIDEIIDTFADYRLLSLDNDSDTRQPTVEVAHEAILREWERLRLWLNESREDIRLQRQLMTLAAEWENAQQDASFLLRGTRLETFQKWASETALALTAKERSFLDASLTQRTKEQAEEESRQARELKLAQETAKAERRAASRLRYLVAVLALAVIGALGLSGVAVNQSTIAQAERDRAQANFALSESQRLAAEANIVLERGQSGELAALLAIRGLQARYSPQADMALQRASRQYYGDRLLTATTRVNAVAFSPDSRYAATGSGDGIVQIWDVETGQEVGRFTAAAVPINSVAFAPDGRSAAVTYAGNTFSLWDITTYTETQQFTGHTAEVLEVTFSPDGRYLFTTSRDMTARMWDVETGEEVRQFVGHTTGLRKLAVSPDGNYLLTTSDAADGTVRLWNVQTGEQIRAFRGHTSDITGVAFSPDGHLAATSSWDRTVRLWDVETGVELQQFTGHTELVFDVAFSPDGNYIVSSGLDTTARVWDVETGQQFRLFAGHIGAVYTVAYSPDGRYILTGSRDGTARIWSTQASDEQGVIAGSPYWTYSVHYSPDQQTLLIGTGGDISLRDATTGEPIMTFSQAAVLDRANFSADNRYVLASYQNNSTYLWDVQTGQSIREFAGMGAVFSPDGRHIFTTAADPQGVAIWDAESGDMQRTLPVPEIVVFALSPDGNTLAASILSSGDFYLIDVATGETLQTFTGHTGFVQSLAFSQDGRYILSGSQDNTARLWGVGTGITLQTFVGHSNIVQMVAFSSDSRYALTVGQEGSARLWDVETGVELRGFVGQGAVGAAAFSPDDQEVLVGSSNGRVYVSASSIESSIAQVCARLLRDFTAEERNIYGITDPNPTCANVEIQPTAIAPTWTPVLTPTGA